MGYNLRSEAFNIFRIKVCSRVNFVNGITVWSEFNLQTSQFTCLQHAANKIVKIRQAFLSGNC